MLARQVGRAERQEGSFEAGSAAILEVLRRLGVPVDGAVLYDGSGLSRENLLTTATLAAVYDSPPARSTRRCARC